MYKPRKRARLAYESGGSRYEWHEPVVSTGQRFFTGKLGMDVLRLVDAFFDRITTVRLMICCRKLQSMVRDLLGRRQRAVLTSAADARLCEQYCYNLRYLVAEDDFTITHATELTLESIVRINVKTLVECRGMACWSIWQTILRCPQIRHVHRFSMRRALPGDRQTIDALAKKGQLETLVVHGCGASDVAFIRRLIRQLPRLTKLDICIEGPRIGGSLAELPLLVDDMARHAINLKAVYFTVEGEEMYYGTANYPHTSHMSLHNQLSALPNLEIANISMHNHEQAHLESVSFPKMQHLHLPCLVCLRAPLLESLSMETCMHHVTSEKITTFFNGLDATSLQKFELDDFRLWDANVDDNDKMNMCDWDLALPLTSNKSWTNLTSFACNVPLPAAFLRELPRLRKLNFCFSSRYDIVHESRNINEIVCWIMKRYDLKSIILQDLQPTCTSDTPGTDTNSGRIAPLFTYPSLKVLDLRVSNSLFQCLMILFGVAASDQSHTDSWYRYTDRSHEFTDSL